ncbi:hypothetical protein ENUP19_0219G0020 [Entamoeba nuttalli]|uniref:Uncharacterized protein n=2 Tax=Entamoeba nuttalli TaxID=412467 RepID=K2HP53_ENTNP|nr:hypothetical protein ENU1_191360 [Entamoeba nuttalli P19]EKE37620.1 hypothetical protein ENU1_191360 [Entamoeba nuttalli P19]|eukprot:XP_008860048.1 hypothetical protein ENU1_191360 [Entamoeba nuttalli P19]
MQPTLFKLVELPNYPHYHTEFPLVTLSETCVEGSFNKRSSSPSDNKVNYISEYKPKRSISSEPFTRQRLTKKNLCSHGFGFLSNEDKEERVYYWIETIKDSSLYPAPYFL